MKPIYILSVGLLMVTCSVPTRNTEEVHGKKEANVEGKVVSYATDDTTNMVGYIAFDANDSSIRPGILVVHEWWGHNEYSRKRAEMLAGLGYVALAVDMYGEGKQATHPDEAGQFAGMVMGNFEDAMIRFESALNTLQDHPYVDDTKVGAIGYCFGGSIVLSMANTGYDLDAVAAFHAGLQLPVMPDSGIVKSKILVANGAADPMITQQHEDDFKNAMEASGVDYKYIAYDGAMHAFTNWKADSLGDKFGLPLAYNAYADSASWAEMIVLFEDAFYPTEK